MAIEKANNVKDEMSKLYYVQPDNVLIELPLAEGDNLVGRDKHLNVQIDSKSVSGQHARLNLSRGTLTITDLKSTNGTRINGKRVTSQVIRHGDVITLGSERLLFFNTESIGDPLNPKKIQTSLGDTRSRLIKTDATPLASPETIIKDERREVEREELVPGNAVAYITLLSGARSGVRFPLQKPNTTLGQTGKQVFQIKKIDGRYKVMVGENSGPPFVNGSPIPEEGQYLSTGDVIELAGARVQFEQNYHR